MFSERTQVLLSPQQRQQVEQLAARSATSVGAVVRAAIDAFLRSPSVDARQAALEELFALEAPIEEWALMEAEIEAGYRE